MKLLKSLGMAGYFIGVQCLITSIYFILRLLLDEAWLNQIYEVLAKHGPLSFDYLKMIASACIPAMIISDVVVCIPLIFVYHRKGYKLISKIKMLDQAWLIAIALILNLFISIIVSELPASDTSNFYNTLTSAVIGDNAVLVFLSTAIAAPVAEEIIFRLGICGILYRDNAVEGILISSLLFGIAHMNPIQSSYAFVLGLVLAYLYTKNSYNIAVPIVMHITINGSSVLFEYFKMPTLFTGSLFTIFALAWLFLDRLDNTFGNSQIKQTPKIGACSN